MILELATLVLQLFVMMVHVRDVAALRSRSGRQITYCPARCTRVKKKKQIRLPTLGGIAMLVPHIAVVWALVLRLTGASERDEAQCTWQVSLLVGADLVGWLRLAEYIMLDQRVGPFFIMVHSNSYARCS